MRRFLSTFLNDDRGAAAIEYALIASLIFIAALGAFAGAANSTVNLWEQVGNEVEQSDRRPH